MVAPMLQVVRPNGVPGVEVVFPSLPVGARAVNVFRLSEGRQMVVRGGERKAVSGGGGR